MKKLLLLLAPLLLAACTQTITDTDAEEKALTLTQLRDLIGSEKARAQTLLIDSRPPSEYAAGHIPHAINLSVAHVSGVEGATDARLLAYKTLIVYGNDPASITAKSLTKRLIATGYKDVRFYPDGFQGWKNAGNRIETSPAR